MDTKQKALDEIVAYLDAKTNENYETLQRLKRKSLNLTEDARIASIYEINAQSTIISKLYGILAKTEFNMKQAQTQQQHELLINIYDTLANHTAYIEPDRLAKQYGIMVDLDNGTITLYDKETYDDVITLKAIFPTQEEAL